MAGYSNEQQIFIMKGTADHLKAQKNVRWAFQI